MRKPALLLILLALIPAHASAFNTTDLLSLVAMPLAVDAVSRVTGVPQDQLAQLVSTLNQANVPPPQFIQTVRYAPVALQQPDFVPYVQTQQSQGINGVQLVDVIDQRLGGSADQRRVVHEAGSGAGMGCQVRRRRDDPRHRTRAGGRARPRRCFTARPCRVPVRR